MFRWFLFTLLLCAGVFIGIALTSPNRKASGSDHDSESKEGNLADPTGPGTVEPVQNVAEVGQLLEVFDARINPIVKTEVPSERDGKLLFIGTEFKPYEVIPTGADLARKLREGKIYQQEIRYLVIALGPDEKVPAEQQIKFSGDPRVFRRWKKNEDPLPAGRLRVFSEMHYFRRLEVGNRVEGPRIDETTGKFIPGDLLALINPALALDELKVKASKLDSAQAEMLASEKTRNEADRRYQRDKYLYSTGKGGSISLDDVAASKLAWDRYTEEVKSKEAAIASAQQELNQSHTVLEMHAIRASSSGTIRTFYKSTGDAVKNLDPILQLHSEDQLQVEGHVELQYAQTLHEMMTKARSQGKFVPVEVEVTQPGKIVVPSGSHDREVTCVAVTRGERPLILSGDEGGNLRCWGVKPSDKPDQQQWSIGKVEQLWRVPHRVGIRALACTPNGAATNKLLVGLADGSAYIATLENDTMSKQVDMLVRKDGDKVYPKHGGPITSVAFSPDGTRCATAEDRKIYVWDTSSVEKEFCEIDNPHKGPVTSVQFLSNDELVSAGRDGNLITWKVEPGKYTKAYFIDHRSNSVPALGVDLSEKGNPRLLVDQGREMRVYSGKTHEIVGSLRTPGSFSTTALFSPNGQFILTCNTTDSKVELWCSPRPGERSYPQRQLTWKPGTTTCAAFSDRMAKNDKGESVYDPASNFVVTGTTDGRVLFWHLPAADEKRLSATLKLVENALDTNVQQVRIWAELTEPKGVIPGSTATMVIKLGDQPAK